MDEPELVNSLYSKHQFCHVESCNVLSEDVKLDKHCHQISSGQELHQHEQIRFILERRVQLDNPRTV